MGKLLLVLLLTSTGSAPSIAKELASSPLRLSAGQGCTIVGGSTMLWTQWFKESAAGVVFAEAEQAVNLQMQPGKEVVRDTETSGGAYVAHVINAEFPFEVSRAGAYQIWARTFLPFQANWNHLESMDNGPQQWISESDSKVFGRWYWSPLGKYALNAGRHTFVLHNWLGGARLDAIIITNVPDFDPEKFTGKSVIGEHAKDGYVTTSVLRPCGVARWHRIELDADLNGGTIQVAVSPDGRKSWVNASTNGALPCIPTRGDGRDTLVARLTLNASPEGKSPIVRAVRALYALAPNAECLLENEHYRIALAKQTGTLCGIYNKKTNTWITPAHSQEPLVEGIAIRHPGATQQMVLHMTDWAESPRPNVQSTQQGQVVFQKAKRRKDGWTLTYHALEGQIRIVVTLTADRSALCRMSYHIENNSEMEVIRLDFPRIGNAAVGDGRDDELILPLRAGQRLRQPSTHFARQLYYPGNASMGWMELCDTTSGVYLSVYDRSLTMTELGFAPSRSGEAVDLCIRTYTLVKPGKSRTREFVIGIHAGDWHWGADRYREYASSFMKKPNNPEWVKWTDGWMGTGGLAFNRLGEFMEQTASQGFEYIQLWGWMADGIDQCCGNFSWPAPALGDEQVFIDGIKAVHQRGGKITAYVPSRLWTRDSAVNPMLRKTKKEDLPEAAQSLMHDLQWFEKNRLYPLDGKPLQQYDEELGWFSMCPASQGWYDHTRHVIIDLFAQRWGMDGAYIDELGAARAWPCYNLNHGHHDIGEWGMGHVRNLKTVSEEGRRLNPDFCLSIEGCGDAFGQYANLHLISGLCPDPEVFRYTFPDYILLQGFANNGSAEPEKRIYRAHLNGDRFDYWPWQPKAHSAVALRKRIKWWLYPARFMDTLGLRFSCEKVQGRWNLCDNKGEKAIVVCIVNDEKVEGATCSLNLPKEWGKPRSLALFDREGNTFIQKPVISEGRICFDVPASTLSAAVIAYTIHPKHAVDVWTTVTSGKDTGEIVIHASSIHDRPVRLTLTLSAPQPLRLPQTSGQMTIPVGSLNETTFKVEGLYALQLPASVKVRATWADGSTEQSVAFRPILLNGSLDIDENHDGIPDGWDVGGTTRQFPYGIEEGAFWIQGQSNEYVFLIQNVPIKPNTKYYFAGQIKKSKQTPDVRMALVESLGDNKYNLYAIGEKVATLGEWERFEREITTSPKFNQGQVYLYCVRTDAKAWYDDIELREMQ